jgi:hypothetical protein
VSRPGREHQSNGESIQHTPKSNALTSSSPAASYTP